MKDLDEVHQSMMGCELELVVELRLILSLTKLNKD